MCGDYTSVAKAYPVIGQELLRHTWSFTSVAKTFFGDCTSVAKEFVVIVQVLLRHFW